MNRVIKFRAKRPDDGKWVFGDFKHHQRVTITGLEPTILVDNDPVILETIGQFTGLLDKNGKEIYEDDVVTWTDSDGNQRMDIVKWMRGGLCLCNANYTVGSYGGLDVIGNVVNNPELLKGGKE